MILRVLQWLFGCGHHAVVHVPGKALTSIARCERRAFHDGPHSYPYPWREDQS